MKRFFERKTIICTICLITIFNLTAHAAAPENGLLRRLVAANSKFGFKIFSEVRKTDGGKNVFISPSSIAFALAMTYNGAKGETEKAMAKVLELEGLSLDEIGSANAALMEELTEKNSGIKLSVANSLWGMKGFVFKKDFFARGKKYFQAALETVDFADPKASGLINAWVGKKTEGKIDRIVNRLSPLTSLVLVDAIYFKGNWEEKFDKTKTKDRNFFPTGSAKKTVPMMSQSGEYNYFKGDSFQAVRLPYAKDRFGMYIFLPDKDSNLKGLTARLTQTDWQVWLSKFKKMEGDITIPRFKLEYDIKLNNALTAIGMALAFDSEKANLTGIADVSTHNNLYISDVFHKTFMDVNEEGTEATAATTVIVNVKGLPIPEDRFEMIVDRPFFMAIEDSKTKTILFMGAIEDPK